MNNTQENIRAQSHKDPAQLEHEIGQQRRHIEDIVSALENKLSPGEIFDRVLNFSKGGGREFAGNLSETIKQNPVPALLTAAGMMWLYSAQRNPSYGSTVIVEEEFVVAGTTTSTDAASTGSSRGISDRLHSATSTVGDKARGAKDSIASGAHSAGSSIKSGAVRAKDGYSNMLQDNPLAAGAIAVAVGALLGAMLPPTRKEDELMGEASDRTADQLRSKAREGKEKVTQHAREMAEPKQREDRDSISTSGTTGATGGTTGTAGLSSTQGTSTSEGRGSQRAH